jgi:hypothetical protein
MRVTSIIGATLGLLAAAFGQSNTQPQTPSSAAPSTVLSLPGSPAHDKYVGDQACGPCHLEMIDSFHQTAHYVTSRLPARNSILGSFSPEANTRTTSNPELSFRMEQKQDGFFQTAVQGIAPYTTEHTERFGLVIGSGGKGQTYLFWKEDRLFQLPVSYWTELGWVNSPGYKDGIANFDRPITPRCLECHATNFDPAPPPPNRYRKTGFIVGITCEKCHGPGREHVEREGSKRSVSSDSAILNPAKFSRDRQMDLCAWCHAGHGVALVPPFSYVPGEPLEKYLELPSSDPSTEFDVHGSQVELLEKSRCFQSSAMTCLTCHDVHTVQHDPLAFSQRCLLCHKPGSSMFPKLGHQTGSNCIHCHMPAQQTNLIIFDWNGRKAKPRVRSHWIKVYPSVPQSQ